MRTYVTFEGIGGSLSFCRVGDAVMVVCADESGGRAVLHMDAKTWADLHDFFEHPQIDERFDVDDVTLNRDDLPF